MKFRLFSARIDWRRLGKRAALAIAFLCVSLPLSWHLMVRLGSFPTEWLDPTGVQSLTVLDAEGNVLRQDAGGLGGRARWVKLQDIAPALIDATLAAEDHRFYDHAGVDWLALVRSAWLNLKGEGAFGGSTLSMQLARTLGGMPRTVSGKLTQALLATRLERVLDKRDILEHYLNRVYYGNGAWGALAAARLYFGKSARSLSTGEAAFLAVLPRGPEFYDPFRHYSRVIRRRSHILSLMVRRQTLSKSERALAERTALGLQRHRQRLVAPHFVDYVIGGLPKSHDRTVKTTLDPWLQLRLEAATDRHLHEVHDLHITQAAVVVIRNADGAILSMVGSGNYFDAHKNGAWNYATARLRPGSTLKPFVYGLALEAGDNPATLSYDLVLPEDIGQFYSKDVKQHGVARYREALAGSYNLSAVHALQRVGLQTGLQRLRAAGLTTLDRPDESYDIGLAIGHAEVRLLDLIGAFSAFGRGGVPVTPYALAGKRPAARPAIFSEKVAYLLYDILSDPDARRPMFGQGVPLVLPFPVALKTGTTRAYTDNWAIGVTAQYTIGVWAGNFDGSPTHHVMSMRGATPLLRAAYVAVAARFGEPTAPPEPKGLVRESVCAVSGARPTALCPHRKQELFIPGTEPAHECEFHQTVCGQTELVYPEKARPWALFVGLMSPPRCAAETRTVALRITYPRQGSSFHLDPFRPARDQVPPLRATPAGADIQWTISGQDPKLWTPVPGTHVVRAEHAGRSDSVTIVVNP